MALLRCPLPPDPGYEKTANYFTSPDRDEVLAPRVRPEAQEIAKMHTMGTIAMLLKSQPHSQVSKHTPRRPPTTNHHRANKRRINEIQIKTLMRKEQSSLACSPPRTSNKYSHIQPKVTAYMIPTRPSINPEPVKQVPPGSSVSKLTVSSSPKYIFKATTENPGTAISEKETTASLLKSCKSKPQNFLKRNIATASQQTVKKQKSKLEVERAKERREKLATDHKRGVVPEYLCKRKEQWKREEEERLASLPDPSVPPGHVLMPREEKDKTLSLLQTHHSELLKELQGLSLTADTVRVRQRKKELENKLTEVDDALKIFSRPKVFVKISDGGRE